MTSWVRGSIVSCALGGAFVLTVALPNACKRANLHRRPQAHRRVRPPEPGVEAAERVRGRAGARNRVSGSARCAGRCGSGRSGCASGGSGRWWCWRRSRRTRWTSRWRGGNPPPIAWPAPPLPDGPIMLESAEQRSLRVVVITKNLEQPWSIAFLPDGAILVTERPGRLRIIRNGVLDPNPVAGVPPVRAAGLQGLMDVVLHPRFAENQLIHLSYHKPVVHPSPPREAAAGPSHRPARRRWRAARGTARRSPTSATSSSRAPQTQSLLGSPSAATACCT